MRPTNVGNDRGAINVLVARFSAPGNVVMTVPVLYSACRCYPDVHFVMLTSKELVSVFVNAPNNLTVIGVDVYSEYKGISGTRRLLRYIFNHYKIDTFIDLHNSLRSRLTSMYIKFKGVRVAAINAGRDGKNSLTRRHSKVMLSLTTQRARYREAFFKAGLPVQEQFHGLYGRHGRAEEKHFAAITAPKREGEIWIGVAPFAAFPPKEYPAQLMHQVLERLNAIEGVRLFIFGGAGDEARRADNLVQQFANATSLAGKNYGFGAELALMSHLDAMLTMDSVNMHMASIVRTPTISVWGATHPYCGFKGWHQSDNNTVQLPLTCRPCSVFGNKSCFRGDFLCMNAIRPEQIVNKILDLLPTPSTDTDR